MMSVNRRGSEAFWHSTAAMITAIGTLIAALVALAAFVVGQQWFGGPDPGGAPAAPGEARESRVRIDQDDVRWGPSEFRVTELMAVELDTVPPVEADLGGDLYIWPRATMSSAFGLYVWPGEGVPSATDCATYLISHGRKGDELPFAEGTRLCVRTDEGRTALAVVKSRDGTDAWLVDLTVWNPRG